ncbi:hypothetical protein [Helicobacter salomonis]|uniref:hypothetical protein n=1 Tax=Helicobacter salomonis TaxID=56878 RepID=UPI000CF0EE5E|nr:hypothetical protein [Helicobacter salomonis]
MKYTPLRHKWRLQNNVFDSKNEVFYKPLMVCRDGILPFCVRLAPEDVGLQAVQEILDTPFCGIGKQDIRYDGSYHSLSLKDYQEQEHKFKGL